jgi:hypothetical protein
MKKILVLYYTQTGQLLNALHATFRNLESDSRFEVTYVAIEPQTPYPYPWSYMEFWDAFPETYQGVPCPLKPLPPEAFATYDLVVIGYQPWFLSVCRPVDSFLQTADAKKILAGKPVVTLLACRNMWVNAQEKMKLRLKDTEAALVGNITYVDRSGNLTSLVSVLAYTLGGIKGKFMGVFPKFGVPDEELQKEAWKFGDIVGDCVKSGELSGMQQRLVAAGAVKIKPNLLIMEGRGKKLFPLYAKFITRKGYPGSRSRRTRVRIFGIVLPTLILILSPLITITSRLTPLILPGRFRKAIEYHSGVSMKN